MFVVVFCAKKLFKMFAAAFASAIECPSSSCSSSISEDESTIELFFTFTNATISSSLFSPDVMTSSSQRSKCSISFCEKAFIPCFSAPIEKAFRLPTLAVVTAVFTE
ncbi:hypothetical protein AVEN_17332-1 [Araneus ventricosus]|uniref:Secreted protein n=1 Tax=Araneus ventricosus TaxID=182803 RepID=A0A4Y2TWB8_ARAVE|nr:hypothetical protein AVEN_54887-1 [Araneus ventricosus]GBN65198.1 hypothetical protein AVEN_194988-1 [Araneus ventricosus]GBO03710.1 hypothetical protein AVEN_132912-1 [Araneus ventricosus]GBO03712.1 hypothetical protein AVEN_17332-1 [Araneus ventricosus]